MKGVTKLIYSGNLTYWGVECIWNDGQNQTLIYAVTHIHAMSPALVHNKVPGLP